MSKLEKTILSILSGSSDANINFRDLQAVLESLGFSYRIKGSHHIYSHSTVNEIINIQPLGAKAKAYQVKQVRNIIIKYKLIR
jgi:predicted RNA binding protein YcfA (HicA-like mRNA interferase family)